MKATVDEALRAHLFSRRTATVFAVLDGASVPALPEKLRSLRPEYVCLFNGALEPEMAEVAPYLVLLEHDSPFTDWLLTKGWGMHWGIFGNAFADLPTLEGHFKRLTIVCDERGRAMYFRFYDPRVWRVFLPACTPDEVKRYFGPVVWYLTEGEGRDTCRSFFVVDHILRESKVSLG